MIRYAITSLYTSILKGGPTAPHLKVSDPNNYFIYKFYLRDQ